MLWTEESTKTLISLWCRGWSATQVATALSRQFQVACTKNAVLGKLNRMIGAGKLTRRADYRPKKKMLKPVEISRVKEIASEEKKAKKTGINVAPVVVKNAPLPPVCNNVIVLSRRGVPRTGESGVTIDQTTGCLYAINATTKGIHLFCNKPKKDNSAYCDEHHAKCHAPPQPIKKLRIVK